MSKSIEKILSTPLSELDEDEQRQFFAALQGVEPEAALMPVEPEVREAEGQDG